MPTLNWIGKEKVMTHHHDVPFHVLDHKYGFDSSKPGDSSFTGSGNMIIHGDNLTALKSLLPKYEGRIKCIYIDPPYNTGNEKWVYNDNVNDPRIKKWLGEVVGTEGEDLSRDDKWLCMMYPRLSLLAQLLSEDGVIFISIDDNEQANLKLLCDEVFGSRNFVASFCWVRKKKGSFLSKSVRKMTEYVLCYQKSSYHQLQLFGEKAYTDKWQPIVKRTNGERELVFPAGCISTKLDDGIYKSGFRGKEGTGLNFVSDFEVRGGKIITEVHVLGHFIWQQSFLDEELANGTQVDLSKQFGFNVLRYNQSEKIKSPSTLINADNGVGTNEDATAELQSIFSGQPNEVFQYSKPKSLIAYLLNMVVINDPEAIILDSFAGSGTTAHAVLELNKEDDGKRTFILVEMEDYADDITAERIRRVSKDYISVSGKAGSFDFYELGKPLLDENGHINEEIHEDKIREYIYYSETRNPLIRPHKAGDYLLDTFNHVGYYFYYKPNEATVLSIDTLSIVTEEAESYVIYADICNLSESYMAKHNIVFKQIPRDIKQF